jgi:thiosulfate/3-mercaptopyruvate sulfurtransferase
VEGGNTPDELASALGTLGLDPDDPVITYCNAGNTASAIAFAMALMRHQRVSIYDGSLRDWAADPTLPMNSPATD